MNSYDNIFYDTILLDVSAWVFLMYMCGLFACAAVVVLLHHLYKEIKRARLRSAEHDYYYPHRKH